MIKPFNILDFVSGFCYHAYLTIVRMSWAAPLQQLGALTSFSPAEVGVCESKYIVHLLKIEVKLNIFDSPIISLSLPRLQIRSSTKTIRRIKSNLMRIASLKAYTNIDLCMLNGKINFIDHCQSSYSIIIISVM